MITAQDSEIMFVSWNKRLLWRDFIGLIISADKATRY